MNILRSGALLLAVFALGTAAFAQGSGGSDAKGNAPLKAAHTVNDGTPKPGATSFTQAQARQHILKSGYDSVSSLAKGQDGVWRGVATKAGAEIGVALDFKGDVTEGRVTTSAPPTTR